MSQLFVFAFLVLWCSIYASKFFVKFFLRPFLGFSNCRPYSFSDFPKSGATYQTIDVSDGHKMETNLVFKELDRSLQYLYRAFVVSFALLFYFFYIIRVAWHYVGTQFSFDPTCMLILGTIFFLLFLML